MVRPLRLLVSQPLGSTRVNVSELKIPCKLLNYDNGGSLNAPIWGAGMIRQSSEIETHNGRRTSELY
jgi:hypothetical protein